MKPGIFALEATDYGARAGKLHTAHGVIETPVFMPVGTKASVKSLDPGVLEELGTQVVLGNTYHLYLAPGDERIRALGGLHQFMQWNKPILTDSGGFQVFSLGEGKKKGHRSVNSKHSTGSDEQKFEPEAHVTENGVEFRSHKDGSKHFFTPEKSIKIQANLGADIIMAFDQCPPYPSTLEYYRASMQRTHRWLDRCIVHKHKLTQKGRSHDQLLFGIVQGGVDKELREESARFVASKGLPGVAIGGVANGGEDRTLQMQQVEWVMPHLPQDKPRYLMGIGTPLDLSEFVARGIDMFDCVLPTRLARNGAAWIVEQRKGMRIQIKNAQFKDDATALDETCLCSTCKRFSRAYLHHLFMEHEPLAMQLLSVHNLFVLLEEMRQIRASILEHRFAAEHARLRALWGGEEEHDHS